MFITECRLFCKRKKLIALVALISMGIFLWGYRVTRGYETVSSLCITIEIAPYAFIVFLLVSYLYIQDHFKDGIAEVVAAISDQVSVVWYKVQVLQIWNVILTAYFIGMNILFAIRDGRNMSAYIQYIVELWLLYFALPTLLACFLGASLACQRNKRITYAGLVVFSYVFAGGFVDFLQMMSLKTDVIYRVADFFCIFARGTRRAPNEWYLISVEGHNWLRILLWIIMMGILLVIKLGAYKTRRWVCISSVVFVGMLLLYIQPFGSVYFDNRFSGHDEWSSDQNYYAMSGYEGETEAADFKATDYDIRFKVGRELQADVVIRPDRTELTQYIFTLYHGYRVKTISDQDGNQLSYDRWRDYIRIYNQAGRLEEIHIGYVGHSLNFYATSQGIRLPAYFAYYPKPGCRRIFDNELYEYTKPKEEASHFHVTVDAPEEIFCSLEQNADGSYEGETEGLTIEGSRFLKCYEAEGYKIVYSGLRFHEDEMKAWSDQLNALGVTGQPLKTIFIEGHSSYDVFYSEKGHMITYGVSAEEDYEKYVSSLRGEKRYD